MPLKQELSISQLPKDGVLGIGSSPSPLPTLLDEKLDLLAAAIQHMYSMTHTIHSSLSRALSLPKGEVFEDFHHFHRPSPFLLRLLKYHAQPADERGPPGAAHTDLGSLTILFTKQPGLQVLMKGAKDWTYVDPKPGMAVVIIGDGMSMMTGGLLRSSLHRISPPAGGPMEVRYSFAYLQRAEEHAPLVALNSPLIPVNEKLGRVVTSGEWLRDKFGMLRANTHDKEKQWILTG